MAEEKETKKIYAIKAIKKIDLLKYGMIKNAEQEAEILIYIKHPFLIDLEYLFHSKQRIYFVLPYIQGGEMADLLFHHQRFKEEVILFYAA